MPNIIKLDSANRPETPTLILSKKNGEHIGVLSNATQIRHKANLNSYDEISFTVYKELNGKKNLHWDDIVDFRIIYVPEWKKRFELHVEINEVETNVKTVTGVSLCEEELSHLYAHGVEINTEKDIDRKDYTPSVLYDEKNPKASMLNRIIADEASHYKIIHVDTSIKSIQRTFSFDDTIYDAFMEISKEIHCLFIFGKETDDGYFRTISVYDLESYCPVCNYRNEFTGKCPKCGSFDISEGYGNDTTIFLSQENLTEEINYSVDKDSVMNCFKLEAGDDDMTTAIINGNPSGSSYIWYIPDYMKRDMSSELVDRLDNYNQKYEEYETTYQYNLSSALVEKYNQLIEKYKVFNKKLESITTPVVGYQNLIKIYYDTIDFSGYLKNSLMPHINIEHSTAKEQLKFLTPENLSPISVENIKYISLATANSAILNYAKVYIDSAKFKIKIKDSSISGVAWRGSFTVTSYFDEEDTADSTEIDIIFNNDYENFLKQKIDKILAKEDEDVSIIGLFKKDETDFSLELKKYCLSYLLIFQDACEACLNILIEQGVPDKNNWNTSSNPEANPYEKIYLPYLKKKELIEKEIKLREDEISIIIGKYDNENNLLDNGIYNLVENEKNKTQQALNFKNFLGDYWVEFSTFRREDVWKNDNYISDGLSNSDLFKKVNDFLNAARKELYKSATLQHSISTKLKNLLIIPAFKPLIESFSIGNWLRIMIDEQIYKLRLISYEIDYDDLENIDVEFSDVTNKLGVASDIESVLKQSKAISSSYNSVKRQAAQGEESNQAFKNWVEKGLDASITKIVNSSNNQDVVYDKNGILLRKYDDFTGKYSDEQTKLINSSIVMTTDNWKTSKVGIGKFTYYDPKDGQMKEGYGIIANQLVGGLLLSEEIGIYNKTGSMTFDDKNGLKISNKTNTVTINPNETNLFVINKGEQKIFYVDDSGNLNITGTLTAGSGSKIGYWGITDTAIYNTNATWGATNGKYFGDHGLSISDKFKVDAFGNVTASGTLTLANGKFNFSDDNLIVQADVSTENLRATGGKIANFTISHGYLHNGISIGKADSCGLSSGTSNDGSDDRMFWAGNDTFRVTKQGKMFSKDAQISGGKIGGFNIEETGLYSGKDKLFAGIDTDITLPVFWSGTTYAGRKTAPFQVAYSGKMKAPEILVNTSIGSIFIGESNDTGIDTLSILPNKDNTGSIGSPTKRWNAIYGNVIGQSPVSLYRNNDNFDISKAYTELENMQIYSSTSENEKININALPKSIQSGDTFNLADLLYWSIAVMKAAQNRIKILESKLEEKENGK